MNDSIRRLSIVVLAAGVSLTACADSPCCVQRIDADFKLVARDRSDGYHLAHRDGNRWAGLVRAPITAIGSDEKHIIVRRKPDSVSDGSNTHATGEFFIVIKENHQTIGPLTLAALHTERARLGVSRSVDLRIVSPK
jgi:hypothetical protein